MIDYKRLLVAYIDYVIQEEGVTFLECENNPAVLGLTDDEFRELKRCAAEEFPDY